MRKKLLSEAQVRRFQSLASIKPLNEMDHSYARDDEDMNEGDLMEEEDMDEALYEEEDEEMDMDVDEDEDEGEDMGDADVEMDEELVDQFLDAVKTIEQVADALSGAGAGEDMDMGGDDMKMDLGGDDAPQMDAPPAEDEDEDEEAVLEEALRGISYVPSQKEVVKLVAKRVAKRLQEAKRAERRLNRALGKRR